MLPCEDVRQLAEEYVSDTLDAPRRAEVARHLQVCASCHRVIEEARLAQRVLRDAGCPAPPPRLADRIKHAAGLRLTRRPRPLHERALGSPAFLATCASLLCGAVICLLAIMKVAYVQPWPQAPPPSVTIVETLRLPAREIVTALPVATSPAFTPTAAPVRRPLALMNVTRRHVPLPATRPLTRRAAPRPLTAPTVAAPTMTALPQLPTPFVTPAGVRISRPDGMDAAPRLELESLDGARPQPAEASELAPVGLGAAARGSFTNTR